MQLSICVGGKLIDCNDHGYSVLLRILDVPASLQVLRALSWLNESLLCHRICFAGLIPSPGACATLLHIIARLHSPCFTPYCTSCNVAGLCHPASSASYLLCCPRIPSRSACFMTELHSHVLRAGVCTDECEGMLDMTEATH